MCGRYSLSSSGRQVKAAFETGNMLDFKSRYNITPSTDSVIVRLDDGDKVQALHNWGFLPHWAKPDVKVRPINAKAETVKSKPFFREAFKNKRCLVVANGYYEWQGDKGRKQPWYIRPIGADLIAFAGLWDRREGEDNAIDSYVIITTEANQKTAKIHNRMPVILQREDYDTWLEGGDMGLLKPCDDRMLEAYKVSTRVNKPGNEGSELIKPV